MKIETKKMPIKDLHPNTGQVAGLPKNPRFVRDEKFTKLKLSLAEDPEFMEVRPIVAYDNGGELVIVGGNMRYRALKDMGEKDAHVIILPQETPVEKLRAFTIKDNVGYGEWSWDDLANEWETIELDNWGLDVWQDTDGDVKEDEAEEDNFNPSSANGKPKAKEGDIFRLGKHRLICGDSTEPEVLQILMGDQKADLLLTDPPYNVDYSSKLEAISGNRLHKDIANDNMEDGAFKDFLCKAFANANTYLKPGGAFYIWYANTKGLYFKSAVQETGWDLKQVLIWIKNSIVLGRQDYQWKHEPCLYGWKPGASHYFVERRDLTTITEEEPLDLNALTKQELKDLLTKVLNLPTTDIHEDKPLRSADHPTMKPLKLMGRLIKNSTRPGEVVLDPFGGSGSTMMAAEQLGRACFMVELDPAYIDVICKRYEELTGEKAEYLGNFKTEAK